MKTCKDCIHYAVCGKKPPEDTVFSAEQYCPNVFKDKSLVLDLPCEIGRTVFIIGSKYRHGRIEHWINTGKFKLSDVEKLGKTIFLSPEKAKQALKEMQTNG